MIFVDSNIPMYLIGADHPNKVTSEAVVRRLLNSEQTLITDAEVYQEILHRYSAIKRSDAIAPAFDLLDQLTDACVPVTLQIVRRAKVLLETHLGLSARDAIHVAVMESNEIREVLSFDSGFDAIPGLQRVIG